ncbi:hypothetical protein DICVIV_00257 [Dictyocaulus viviparus]|uniref:Uncharacterized protein n=1 Tax=Dictyocaulus viviparus TaxID=29172 RepID=A0A0D8YBT6_DICVI|nr:hypothetical protein DICVIV_00257 [Dictyocaulus viviparus]
MVSKKKLSRIKKKNHCDYSESTPRIGSRLWPRKPQCRHRIEMIEPLIIARVTQECLNHIMIIPHRAEIVQTVSHYHILRYGSTEQLHYKSPFINSSGYGSSSFYRSNNNFTKAGSVGYSVPDTSSRSYRDYASTSSYSNNSSASKYRTSYGLSSSLSYQPKTNFDIRSKTPSYERESNSQANFFNRDCRSVPRIEKISLNTSELKKKRIIDFIDLSVILRRGSVSLLEPPIKFPAKRETLRGVNEYGNPHKNNIS